MLDHRFSVNSPLSPSITRSLFHSWLKTHLLHKSFLPHRAGFAQYCLRRPKKTRSGSPRTIVFALRPLFITSYRVGYNRPVVYAVVVCPSVCQSVYLSACDKSELCQNTYTKETRKQRSTIAREILVSANLHWSRCSFQYHHPLSGVDSVHLEILLMGTCRQRGSRSVRGLSLATIWAKFDRDTRQTHSF